MARKLPPMTPVAGVRIVSGEARGSRPTNSRNKPMHRGEVRRVGQVPGFRLALVENSLGKPWGSSWYVPPLYFHE